MDVAVSALRADLSNWIERVRAGEEVVVTERGTPVARLLPVESASLLERLLAEGVLAKPLSTNRPTAHNIRRIKARGSAADAVSEQRR
jgi:prevent-host-death family protein